MLTVDFDRLGLVRGERLLDLGAGRRPSRVRRRCGAARASPRSTTPPPTSRTRPRSRARCSPAAKSASTQWAGVVNGDALDLPFPDNTFDRVDRVGSPRAHLGRRARDRRDRARAAPGRPRRRNRSDALARARVLGAQRQATTTRPAATSASTASTSSNRSSSGPGCFLRGSHHAHAFHSPYWWLKCAYGLDNTDAAPVKRYHDFLVPTHRAQPALGGAHRACVEPRPRQEPRRVRREGAARHGEMRKAQP